MAKTNFYLKPFVNKQGEQLINLVFNYQNQRLVYSTAQTINKRDWNDAKTEQRVRRSFKEYKSINDYLDELDVQVNAIYRTAKAKGKAVNNDFLRRELDAFLNKTDYQ